MTMDETRRGWTIVFLIFFFMLINYADKAVIGLSAVPIMRELGLSNTEFGTLGSAFFLLFSLSGVLVGFLANRIASKPLLLILALVWGAAQAPMAGTVGFTTLLIARIVLGTGEGPAFPLALHAVYKWFDDTRRTVPTSIVACGAAFGAGIIAPGVTAIIVLFGWHAAFATLSVASLLWAVAWGLFGAEGRLDARSGRAGGAAFRRPYARLLLSRTALGVFIGGFVAYWAITLNVVWLAAYLTKGAGFTPLEAGWIIVLPSLAQIVMAPTLGAWSEWLVRRGVSSRVARGVLGGCCLVTAGVAMVLFPLVSVAPIKLLLVVLAFATGSVFFTLGSTLIGEISPPSQRGALLGITNSIHALAGVVAPVLMGAIVDVAADPVSGFRTGFLAAGAFVAAGGIAAMALAHPEADHAAWAERIDATAD
ncbi:MFS transporter [Aliidongia dinghuensis]|uniref:MFS transporter n=1 Tax=Aliidongia dinghuensis TaxID=1867774 RepID=A0A8J2YZZ4_9PROT|nr:MFS transporter [Aliidongia dinghuensis]GGF48473.1 MFS transporter [Aliidongia dinghuensis]